MFESFKIFEESGISIIQTIRKREREREREKECVCVCIYLLCVGIIADSN